MSAGGVTSGRFDLDRKERKLSISAIFLKNFTDVKRACSTPILSNTQVLLLYRNSVFSKKRRNINIITGVGENIDDNDTKGKQNVCFLAL
jgi:hypothetical protein